MRRHPERHGPGVGRFRDAMDHRGAEDVEVGHDPSGEVDCFIDSRAARERLADLPYGCARS